MSRIPKWHALPGGKVSTRVELPSAIVKVVEQFSQDIGITAEATLRMMFRQIAHRFDEGDAMFLSTDFQQALRVVREKHFGVINESAPSVDLSRVHRSTKTKSGFVGVYANGKGFRAMGRTGIHSTALKHLGTYQTAEEAAWRRYCYYKENGLPYGELEIEMERWRSGEAGGGAFKGTDEELIAAIRAHAQNAGTEEEIFGADGGNAPRSAKRGAKAVVAAPEEKLQPIGFDPNDLPDVFKDDAD